MERLTERIAGITGLKACYEGCDHPDNGCDCVRIRGALIKLSRYEDTGLTPEEINAQKNALMGKSIAQITEFDGVPIDRLRELAEADRDGRCVILPAKEVYVIDWKSGKNCDGDCCISINGVGECRLCEKSELKIQKVQCTQELANRIGKDVFLTRSEAEAALEKEEHSDGKA